MSRRAEFLRLVRSKLGAVVCWAHKGPEVFDCSGLVTWALMEAGGPDVRDTHNANRLFHSLPAVANPEPGDLALWSSSSVGILTHVAIVTGANPDGDTLNAYPLISADGASPTVDLPHASESATCRVREHTSVATTGRMYFRGFRRFTLLEE